MSELENNIEAVKEKSKIEILKKSIQDGLLLVQKYERLKKRNAPYSIGPIRFHYTLKKGNLFAFFS